MNQMMAWRYILRVTRQSIIPTQTRDCATDRLCLLYITKWRLIEMAAVWDISCY